MNAEGEKQPGACSDDMVLAVLQAAFQRDRLALHYQPQVRLDDGVVTGFEALLRCSDPEHGPVSPARFIPLAEASGLIHTLGQWVLRRACVDAVRLRGAYGRDVRVAVNVSPLQLEPGNLPQLFAAELAAVRLDPQALELELTESLPLPAGPEARQQLARIRASGVSLALDDFGVAYANLNSLLDLAVDTLKIAGIFVCAPDDNPRAAAVLRAIMLLAAQLNLAVVAECAETESHLQRLRAACAGLPLSHTVSVQGFCFSRPLDCDSLCRDAENLCAHWRDGASRQTR